jgi:FkbM family methyltransferase
MHTVQTLRRLRDYIRWFGASSGVSAFVKEGVGVRSSVVVVRPRGREHTLALRLGSSDIPTFRKVLVDCEYELPISFEPKTILDAGANVGLSAVYFASRFPDAEIVAIEPERANFELLQRNVAPYPNVTCLRKALVGVPRTVSIVDPGEGSWAFQAAPPGAEREAHIDEVEGVTVLDVMRTFGWTHIDLLKLDIEGSEKEVFEAAYPWIDSVDIIVAELHDTLRRGCSLAFYTATASFRQEFHKGENVFLVR